MKRLIVMRHAKSDWSHRGLSDHDRPLNARGQKAAPRMGSLLHEKQLRADVILASTACRVRETLELLLPEWKSDAVVMRESSLYLASAETIQAHVRSMTDDWSTVMLVGHNPGLSELVFDLSQQAFDLPTAAIVVLESSEPSWFAAIGDRNWRMIATWLPRELE